MDRQDVAIVLNTCPKYFYLMESCIGLLRRYSEGCHWPIFLATEFPEVLKELCQQYNVHILPLDPQDSDFLQSREAAMRLLPEGIRYVLPLQEDFLLERHIDKEALTEALQILDSDHTVQSIRLMPCPGSLKKQQFWGRWERLMLTHGDLVFSFQATLWRRELYQQYMARVVQTSLEMNPELKPQTRAWNKFSVEQNPAENSQGQRILADMDSAAVHLCWPRKAAWSNAVYWCPWPYRPTAVVKGDLQQWAKDLIRREGFVLRALDVPKEK